MRYAFIGPMETMHLNAPTGNARSPKTVQTRFKHSSHRDVKAMNCTSCSTDRAKPHEDGKYQRGV